MKSPAAPATVLAAVALIVAAAALVRTLPGGGGGSGTAARPAAAAAPPVVGAEAEARLRRLEEFLAAGPPAGPSVAPAAAPGADGGRAVAAHAPRADGSLDEAFRAGVLRVIREEREASRGAEEPAAAAPAGRPGASPSLAQVAATLGLDDARREALARELLRGQERTLELLRIPAADGTVFAERIAEAFLDDPANPGKALLAIFAAMGSTEVPGTGETYAHRAEAVTRSLLDGLRGELTAEQFRAFEALGHDPLDIEVPGNPWNEFVLDVQRRRSR